MTIFPGLFYSFTRVFRLKKYLRQKRKVATLEAAVPHVSSARSAIPINVNDRLFESRTFISMKIRTLEMIVE